MNWSSMFVAVKRNSRIKNIIQCYCWDASSIPKFLLRVHSIVTANHFAMELPSLLSNAELLFSFAFSEVIDAVKISFGWEGICRPGRKKREREKEQWILELLHLCSHLQLRFVSHGRHIRTGNSISRGHWRSTTGAGRGEEIDAL